MKRALVLLAAICIVSLAGCDFFNPPATYSVYYDANGGTGTPPVDTNEYEAGASATVAAIPALTKVENTLGASWNTAADGSGISYDPSDTITMNSDVVLYAQWTDLIVGDWTSTIAANAVIDITDDTTIGADGAYSITRTLKWSAAAGALAGQTVTVEMAITVLVPLYIPDVPTLMATLGLLGITATTGDCSNVLESGTYTRVLGSAAFTTAIASAAHGSITFTGYMTKSVQVSTNPLVVPPIQQNWVTHFGVDTNTLTLYDGGTTMPVTRVP